MKAIGRGNAEAAEPRCYLRVDMHKVQPPLCPLLSDCPYPGPPDTLACIFCIHEGTVNLL